MVRAVKQMLISVSSIFFFMLLVCPSLQAQVSAGSIVGFVTDITIRDNVVARQAAYDSPLSSIMDSPVAVINVHAFVYEAVLDMFRTKARYMLVEKEGKYLGFISRNKLLSEQGQSPLVFIQSVKQALSTDELQRKWEAVPKIVKQ